MKTFFKVWLSISLIAVVVGIAVLVLAILTGARFEDIPTYSFEETYTDIESIDMEISYGKVKIINGNEFSIDAENLPDNDFDCYVSDKTWIINEKYKNNFNLFGRRFSLRQLFVWEDGFVPKITITIPKDFAAKEISLDIGAGEVEAEDIIAEEGSFNIDAGRLYIDELTINGKSSYTVGAGDLELKRLVAKDVTLDCGVGNIRIDGSITGENYISNGIGNVTLDLDGEEADYSYEVTAGIGAVSIDGDNYHNIDRKKINNDGAENYFNLDCGIGHIAVEFH